MPPSTSAQVARAIAMWSVPVVVIDEALKNALKVLVVQNQQPIETL